MTEKEIRGAGDFINWEDINGEVKDLNEDYDFRSLSNDEHIVHSLQALSLILIEINNNLLRLSKLR